MIKNPLSSLVLPVFMDKNGDAVGLSTPIANVDLECHTPQAAENRAWLNRWNATKPRFEDKQGNPVTIHTPLADLDGF